MRRILFLLFWSFLFSAFSSSSQWNRNEAAGDWDQNNNWFPDDQYPNDPTDIANFDAGGILSQPLVVTIRNPAIPQITLFGIILNSAYRITIDAASPSCFFDLNFNITDGFVQSFGNVKHYVNVPIHYDGLDPPNPTHSLQFSAIDASTEIVFTKHIFGQFQYLDLNFNSHGTITLSPDDAKSTFDGDTLMEAGTLNYSAKGALPSLHSVDVGFFATATMNIDTQMDYSDHFHLILENTSHFVQKINAEIYLCGLESTATEFIDLSTSSGLFQINAFGTNTIDIQALLSGGLASSSYEMNTGNRVIFHYDSGAFPRTFPIGNNNAAFASRWFVGSKCIALPAQNTSLGASGDNSALFVLNEGALHLNTVGVVNKSLRLNGSGYLQDGAVKNIAGSNEITGNVLIGWSNTSGEPLPSDVSVNVSAGTLRWSGIFQGSNALTKLGTGTFELSGASANTFTGDLIVLAGILNFNKTVGPATAGDIIQQNGTLNLQAANQLSSNTNITMENGTMNMGGFANPFSSLTFNGGTINQGGSTIMLGSSFPYALTMQNTTISGNVSLTSSSGGGVQFDTTQNGTATISGTLNCGSVERIFFIPHGTSVVDMDIHILTSTGNIRKQSNGVLKLSSGPSTCATAYIENGILSMANAFTCQSLNIYPLGEGDILGGGNVSVSGNTDVSGVLDVAGTLLSQDASVRGSMNVSNSATINNALYLYGNLNVTGTIGANNWTIYPTGQANIPGIAVITSLTSVEGLLNVSGSLTSTTTQIGAGGEVFIPGTGTLNSTDFTALALSYVDVEGTATMTNNTVIGGFLELGGTLNSLNFQVSSSGRAHVVNLALITNTSTTDGVLDVFGAFNSPTLLVGPSGTLMGYGMVTSNVTCNGKTAPGGSIGTLTVIGNYTFNSGSNFEVELSPFAHDLLDVSGIVTINPGAELTVIPYTGEYATGHRIPVLQGGGGVSGTFQLIQNSAPFFKAIYLPNQVDLEIRYQFSDFVRGGNPGRVADNFDLILPTPDSDLDNILEYFTTVNNPTLLREWFNQLHPSQYKAQILAEQKNCFTLRRILTSRDQKYFLTNDWREKMQDSRGLWIDGFGDYGHRKHQEENIGYKNSSAGGVIGFDGNVTKELSLGAAFAYSYMDMNWLSHGSGRTNSYYGALYASCYKGFGFFHSVFYGGYNFFHRERVIDAGVIQRIAKSKSHGPLFGAHVSTGFLWHYKFADITPFLSFDGLGIKESSFQEKGAWDLNLHVLKSSDNCAKGEAGIIVSTTMDFPVSKVTPAIKASVIKEWRQGIHYTCRFVTENPTFIVRGIDPKEYMFSPGASLTVSFKDKGFFSIEYVGEFDRKYRNHMLQGQFAYHF